jgi:hypothetical protein
MLEADLALALRLVLLLPVMAISLSRIVWRRIQVELRPLD